MDLLLAKSKAIIIVALHRRLQYDIDQYSSPVRHQDTHKRATHVLVRKIAADIKVLRISYNISIDLGVKISQMRRYLE